MRKVTLTYYASKITLLFILCFTCCEANAQIITTIAGNGTAGYSGDGGPATAAEIYNIQGAVKYFTGDLYIADFSNNRIRKVDAATGIISTYAGTGSVGFSGDGGAATAAQLHDPLFIDFDTAGNLYFTDESNNCIRKISTTGIIATVAGIGGSSGAFSGDGGAATAAHLAQPTGIAIDPSGNIYFGDDANSRIRMINTSGIITTIAGTGTNGYSGDGGAATAAQIFNPIGMCVDGSGNLFFADASNNRIRKINSSGIISTIAGTGSGGFSGDGGAATSATIYRPQGVALDGLGSLIFADAQNNRVRKINSSGIISTVAGKDTAGFSGDGGAATAAKLNIPVGVDVDCSQNIYIGDWANNRVRMVNMGINTAPYFIDGPSQTLLVCQSSGAVSINSLLTMHDDDVSQQEWWSVSQNPVHGTLGGFTYTTTSTGGDITPSGVTYTPTSGYSGSDSFKIKIADCAGGAEIITIYVTVTAPSAISGPSSVCVGSTITLTDAISGGVWTSSNLSVATVGSSSGVVTGVGVGTVNITYTAGCVMTTVITVNPLPAAITGTTTICLGATSALSDASTGGIWTSSNPSVASIGSSSGIATGVSVGTATITYTLPTGCYATTPVTVSIPSSITGADTVCVGLTTTFSNATSGGTWTSSNTAIATVGSSSGVVMGVSAGVVTITYTLFTGCLTTKILTVTIPPSITGTASVCAGFTTTLSNPTGGGIWTSGATGVATVGSSTGIVTGVSGGTANITYTLPSGCYVFAVVTVNAVAAITGTTYVCLGLTTTLSDVSPGGTWTSSNPSVASVGSSTGIVSGNTTGTAIITYTIPAGCYATAAITVNPLPAAITGTTDVCVGSTITLSDATGGGTWTSSNTAIATIGSTTGIVTGIAAGSATITYTLGTTCYTTMDITVNPLPDPIVGITSICMGHTTILYDSIGLGVWSSDDISIATIGSSSGIVTTVSVGIVTIRYTLPTGCYVTTTVGPLPPITGVHDMCAWKDTIYVNDTDPHGSYSSTLVTVINLGSGNGQVLSHAPGTATITYSLPTGCAVSDTFTVNPLPTAMTGTFSICMGASTTLHSSPGGGTWTSGTTSVATIGSSSGLVTSVSPGTTIIRYTLPTGCYIDTTFVVNPLPGNITGTAIVCVGATTTLSDAAPGGTWSSATPIVATVGSSTGVVTGVAAGTSVITYMMSTGCYKTKTVTVNATPAAITGRYFVCLGTPDTLADASPGGAWSSSSTAIATVGSGTGLVTGVSTGTATITYAYIGTGCRAIFPIQVMDTVSCGPCAMFHGIFNPLGLSGTINSSVSAGNYYIANNATVVGTITFTSAVVMIAPGDTLFVDTSSLLTLDGSHLFGACDLWQGMMLKPGVAKSGRLYVVNNSMVEDARTAVLISNPVRPSSGYVLKSDSAVFNRNRTGIEISHYNSLDPAYPFLIRNTVVTSRDLGSVTTGYPGTWPHTLGTDGLKTPCINPGAPFTPQYNIDSTSASSTGTPYYGDTLKDGGTAYIGIKLDSVGTDTLTPVSGYTPMRIPNFYADITIGDASTSASNVHQNMFDNLVYGIHATNSNVSCENSVFMHMAQSVSAATSGTTGSLGGSGIYAHTTNDRTNQNRLRVWVPEGDTTINNNRFYNCVNGVECYNYFRFVGQNTFMTSTQPSGALAPVTGRYGYLIKSAMYDTVDIRYDTINNMQNGIAYWATNDWASSFLSIVQYTGRLTIDSNVIQAHPAGFDSITTQSVWNAISVQNVIAIGTIGAVRRKDSVYVNYNHINDVYNGIYLNNFRSQLSMSNSNTIYVRSWLLKPMQYGINHTLCPKSLIYNNYIAKSVGDTFHTDSMKAVYASNNTGINIGCNVEENTGRGFEFFMKNPATAWHDNYLGYNGKGMILNGALIGKQQFMGNPSNNTWVMSSWDSSHPQTYVYHGANAFYDTLFVTTGTTTNPSYNFGFPFPNRYDMSLGNIQIVSGLYDPYCPEAPVWHGVGAAQLYERIAREHIDYPYNWIPNNWIGQFDLWRTILADSTLRDSSATLSVFANLSEHSRYKYITDMEDLLADGNYDSVTVMLGWDIDSMANTSWDTVTQVQMADNTGADVIVENYQSFFALYMKYMSGTLDGTDSLAAMALAQLCPEINGTVVFQARAMYSEIFSDITVFNDDSCLDVDTSYIAEKHSNQANHGHISHTNNDQRYSVFPNPNIGNFTIQQYLKDDEPVTAEMSDVLGRSIDRKPLSFENAKSSIDVRGLPPGIYMLEIRDSRNRVFRFKVEIQN